MVKKHKRLLRHPLRQWRYNYGVTITVLADAAGCSIAHISEIERGIKAASFKLSDRLARATVRLSGFHGGLSGIEIRQSMVRS